MNHTLKNQACKLPAGSIIRGKWYHKSYQIIKPLGYGATGTVYLAKGDDQLVAIKLSDNSMSITSEVNVLRHFSKVQGSALGPSLLDVDDWVKNNRETIPFYVMEYVKGENFLEYMKVKKGPEWLGIFIMQLLADLERLHEAGWVFGDLKPDNLLVTGPPPKVRWLDVGGTTLIGRSIKEYTEFFDRGYWGLGGRKAEPSYDLFAVAMIMINCAYPKRFSKLGNIKGQLKQAVFNKSLLKPYRQIIIKALLGEYKYAKDMRSDLVKVMTTITKKQNAPIRQQQSNVPKAKKAPKLKKKSRSKVRGVIETIVIALFLFFAYTLYLFGQML